jgi:hypothetical protein
MTEPFAYAKLATRGDVLPPFYITDQHVKDKDEKGIPTQIEVVLGRSPPPATPGQPPMSSESYSADYHIGSRMKISKRHAMIYWSEERRGFCIKSSANPPPPCSPIVHAVPSVVVKICATSLLLCCCDVVLTSVSVRSLQKCS